MNDGKFVVETTFLTASATFLMAADPMAAAGGMCASETGTLTAAEAAEIQAIADRYGTTIDVVGSRAEGLGRNIETDFPVGKGWWTRSDIDFRIDASDPQVKDLIDDLNGVGNGAGSAGTQWSTKDYNTYPPYIRFSPKQ